MSAKSETKWDAMLSHSKIDLERVAALDGELRKAMCGDCSLTIWLDDREIQGGSIVAAINEGLETSRHVVLCLTPNYFASRSGWTIAEWQAGLYDDPAGRMDRVIPVMLADVQLPALLRHLDTIDLRPPKRSRRAYETEFARLVRRICAQGRASSASGGREDQSTIERVISTPGPDAVTEVLVTNLLPAIDTAETIVVANIAPRLNAGLPTSPSFPSESGLQELVIEAKRLASDARRFAPAFRRVGNQLISFASPATNRIFATVANARSYRHEPLGSWIDDPERRKVVASLLNTAVRDRAAELRLVRHPKHPQRFFFERPLDRTERKIKWRGTGKPLTVVRSLLGRDGSVRYWLHRAVEVGVEFHEERAYLRMHPTIVLTVDGTVRRVLGGPAVAAYARAYVTRERNGHLHRHLLYWISVWSAGTEAVQVPLGDSALIFDTRPTQVELPYGIAHDQVKIKGANLQDAFIETRLGDEVEDEMEPIEGTDELVEFVEEEISNSIKTQPAGTLWEVPNERN